MAEDGSFSNRPSSSASSELPSLEELLRESPIASQIEQQLPPDDSDRGSNRGTRERSSSSSSSVIIMGESSISDNSNSISSNSSNSNNTSRRSSTMVGKSISGSINNDGITNDSTSNDGINNDSTSSSNADNMDIDINVNTSNKDDINADIHDDTPIPHLTSISAAVFVPIPDSNKLLQPLNLDPDSSAYHRAALDLVTRHESSVRSNLNALFHREMFRIRTAIADTNNPPFDYSAARAHACARDEDALRRDCEAMISNMREPDTPGCRHGVTNIPVPNMNVPVTYVPVGSPREFAAAEVMKVIAAAVGDLASFDRHVRNRRATIKKQIQDAEAGRMDID